MLNKEWNDEQMEKCPKVKPCNRGVNFFRTSFLYENRNNLERILIEEWDYRNRVPENFTTLTQNNLLDRILTGSPPALYNSTGYFGPASERDKFIAATIIQWLGSPIGFAFLEIVLNNAGLSVIDKDNDPRHLEKLKDVTKKHIPGID